MLTRIHALRSDWAETVIDSETQDVAVQEVVAPLVRYTADRASEILGICPSLVRRYCRDGVIKATKHGRDWSISLADITQYDRDRKN